jgi:hypothetical protein
MLLYVLIPIVILQQNILYKVLKYHKNINFVLVKIKIVKINCVYS